MLKIRGRLNRIVLPTAIMALCLLSPALAEWTSYTIFNSPLETDYISSLNISPDGKVLIGTQGWGLYVKDVGSWAVYRLDNAGVPIDYPLVLAYNLDTLFVGSASGNLDVQPLGQGLSILNLADSTWQEFNSGLEISPIITGIEITPTYRVVSTYGGGLTLFTTAGWIRYQNEYRTEFSYADSQQQTFKVNAGTYIPTDYIRGLDYDPVNNILWIATLNGGAVAYDGTNWNKYNIINSGLPSNRIQLIKADPAHNAVYFGTFGFGLAKKIDNSWTVYNTANSPLLSNYVYSMEINPHNGELWIGTNYAINVLNPDSGWLAFMPPDSNLVWAEFYSDIAFDSSGNVWVSTYGGGIASKPVPVNPPPVEDSLYVDVENLKFFLREPRHNNIIWFRADLEPAVVPVDSESVAVQISSDLGQIYSWEYSFDDFHRIFHFWGIDIYSFLNNRSLMLLTYRNNHDQARLYLLDWNPQINQDNIQYELDVRVALGSYIGHDSVYIGPANPALDQDADTLDCQPGDQLLSTGFYPVIVDIDDNQAETPAVIDMPHNYPNPFNPITIISFGVEQPAIVRLTVYDILGQIVTIDQQNFDAGKHEFQWDGSAKASGIYLYSIQVDDKIRQGRMTLLK